MNVDLARVRRWAADLRSRAAATVARGRVATTTGAVGIAFVGGLFTAAAATGAGDDATASDPDRLGLIPPIAAGGTRQTTAVETVEEIVEPGAYEQEDPYLPEGLTRTISSGKSGLSLVTYSVTFEDGVEVAREEIATVVANPPVDDVVAVGALVVPSRPAVVAGTNRAIGQQMAAAYGWTGVQWRCLDNLWERESNWRHLVANPSSGAYGIPQALPADKMASAGPDWKTNPATQISWGLEYIRGRYGTPCYAWGFWNDRYPHWY